MSSSSVGVGGFHCHGVHRRVEGKLVLMKGKLILQCISRSTEHGSFVYLSPEIIIVYYKSSYQRKFVPKSVYPTGSLNARKATDNGRKDKNRKGVECS